MNWLMGVVMFTGIACLPAAGAVFPGVTLWQVIGGAAYGLALTALYCAGSYLEGYGPAGRGLRHRLSLWRLALLVAFAAVLWLFLILFVPPFNASWIFIAASFGGTVLGIGILVASGWFG